MDGPIRAPGEGLELAVATEAAGTRPRTTAKSLEAAEARLPLGVDLAAVERLALVRIAEDLVGGVDLGELGGRVLVMLVAGRRT